MQAGDLADGPLADILRTLAAAGATGGVHVQRRDAQTDRQRSSRDAVLYLRDGRLYAATSPGPRPLLGVRLVAAGAVTREALEEALESQAGELAGWRLGELLVHLGYVDAEIVTEFVVEQILDTVAEVSSWPAGSWRFRRGEKTREADSLALDIDEVLTQVSERLAHWSNLAAWGSKADAVPVRVSFAEDVEAGQMPLARTLLREIDGRRSLAELAVRCGLTTFEAGQVLALLVDSGAVRVPSDASSAPAADALDRPVDVDRPVAPEDAAVDLAPSVAPVPVDVLSPDVPLETVAAIAAGDDPTVSALLPPDLRGPAPQVGDPFARGLDPASDAAPEVDAFVEPSVEPVAEMPAEERSDVRAEDGAPAVETVGPPLVAAVDAPLAAPALPVPAADGDLSALLGAAQDDLGLQLAILARQAEEARFAAEERRHQEVVARRAGATPPAAPIAIESEPVEHVDVAPLEPGQDAAEPAVPALAPVADALVVPDTAGTATDAADDLGASREDTAEVASVEPPAYQRILVEPLPGELPVAEAGDGADAAPLADLDGAHESATALVDASDEPDLGPSEDDLLAWAAAVATEPAPPEPAPAAEGVVRAPLPPRPVGPPPTVAPPTASPPTAAQPTPVAAEDPSTEPATALIAELTGEPAAEPAAAAWDVPELSAAAAFAELAEIEPVAAAVTGEPEPVQDEPEEARPSGDDRAAVHAALAEVAAASAAPEIASETAPDIAPETAPETPAEVEPEPEAYGFTPGGESPFADTASLLRELSSLGLDDAPSAPAAPRTPVPRAATTTAAPAAKPKRKSIFGR